MNKKIDSFLRTSALISFVLLSCAVAQSQELKTVNPPDVADCRARLRSHFCIYSPFVEDTESPTKTCVQDSGIVEPVRNLLLDIFDHLPIAYQRLFCSIPMTYISLTDTSGTVSTIDETGRHTSSDQMQIVLSVGLGSKGLNGPLDRKNSLGYYVTESFESIFNKKAAVSVVSQAPTVFGQDELINIPDLKFNQDYFFMMVHELGHVMDRLNKVNEPIPGCNQPSNPAGLNSGCVFTKTDTRWWSSLSWINQKQSVFDSAEHAGENAFPDRFDFKSLFFGPKIDISKLEQMIEGLFNRTTFLTPLASLQPYDDWAESVVYWILFDHLNWEGPLKVVTPENKVYDMKEIFNSDRFSEKRNFIKNFLLRNDLNYPAPITYEKNFKEEISSETIQGFWSPIEATCVSGNESQPNVPKHLIEIKKNISTLLVKADKFSLSGRHSTNQTVSHEVVVDKQVTERLLVDLQNQLLQLALVPETIEVNKEKIRILNARNVYLYDLQTYQIPQTCKAVYAGSIETSKGNQLEMNLSEYSTTCSWLKVYNDDHSFDRKTNISETELSEDKDTLTVIGPLELNSGFQSCAEGDQVKTTYKRIFKTAPLQ